MKSIYAFGFAALLTLLAACAPVTSTLPPEEPLFFSARYDALFDATLQEIASTYVRSGSERVTFAISEADRDTGLITAVRNEQTPSTSVTLRSRRYHDDDGDHDGVFYGPFFRFYVPVPVRSRAPERTLISAVLRPVDRGATLVYSSTGSDSTASRNADRFMAEVVEGLRERFPAPQLEPTAPQAP